MIHMIRYSSYLLASVLGTLGAAGADVTWTAIAVAGAGAATGLAAMARLECRS